MLHVWEEHEAKLLDDGMTEELPFELPGVLNIPPVVGWGTALGASPPQGDPPPCLPTGQACPVLAGLPLATPPPPSAK
jgi:hypothetical protein